MMQPVGHVLGRDAQGCAVFHQAHIVDVGHLGAADTLFDPAHDVAENTLGVVVELRLDFLLGPVRARRDRHGEDIGQLGTIAVLELFLHLGHIHLVIVGGVQRGSRRRGHPGGIGTRFRMADLLFEHGMHQVGHGPHALADLSVPLEPALKPYIDVPVFVGRDPCSLLHVALADHRTGFHRGVDLVAGAVEETGIDEDHPLGSGANAFLEVDGGAALLIHDAHLDGVGLHADGFFDAVENLDGESHFLGTVHLRLDHIHRPLDRVHVAAFRTDVVERDQTGQESVHDAFGHLVAVLVGDRGIGHEVTDVPYQHQRAAFDRRRLAFRRDEFKVTLELAGEGLAALADVLGEIAPHQAEPVAVDDHLVLGVDGSDRILAIHDGGDGGFQRDVANAGRICLSDHAVGIDEHHRVQAVGGEIEPIGVVVLALEARILRGVLERGFARHRFDLQIAVLEIEAGGIGPFSACKRNAVIKEGLCPGYDAGATVGIVAAGLGQVAQRVGSIERVVERAPAGIGRVERVAGVHHRDDELRSGDGRDFRVDIFGGDLNRAAFRHQITDLTQEGLIRFHVGGRTILAIPGVDLFLQRVAPGEKRAVLRCEFMNCIGESEEKRVRIDARAGDCFPDNKIVKITADRQTVFVDLDQISSP